jgi:hypothetical protein
MMQYSYSRILVVFLCVMIIIDDVNALRLRMPMLRITSSFSRKSDCAKKKVNAVHHNGINIPAETIPLKVRPVVKNDEF